MPVHSADALILRTYRYGEADRIVVFLTADRGKKRGVAKNASKSRRRFGAALEPLTRGRVSYVEREGRELVRLDRVEPSATPLAAAAGRDGADGAHALGHASYFAELIDEWAPENSQNDRLFRLGSAISDALAQSGSIDALARYFEYWLLRLEGVYPSVITCPQCDRTTLAAGAVLAARDRAYVCEACAHHEATLGRDAMSFLRSLGARTPAEVTATGASARSLREIEQAHHRLIVLHLEKELRSSRVVRELRPL